MTDPDEQGDKHRWCRGIVGLDHRGFDPSDFSDRRYCSKCGVEETDYLRALQEAGMPSGRIIFRVGSDEPTDLPADHPARNWPLPTPPAATKPEPVAYGIEADDFAQLRKIERRLHGDGSSLTPDSRRDLANHLSLILGKAVPLNEGDIK